MVGHRLVEALRARDTDGSLRITVLAEETDAPRRRAPRAILLTLGSVGVAGSLLVFTALRAVGDDASDRNAAVPIGAFS